MGPAEEAAGSRGEMDIRGSYYSRCVPILGQHHYAGRVSEPEKPPRRLLGRGNLTIPPTSRKSSELCPRRDAPGWA
jgi:hypothetical protein